MVTPGEIVSLCGVDKKMMADCAKMAATPSLQEEAADVHRLPRDLRQKDLDVVEIATPDHRHALPTIKAAKPRTTRAMALPIRPMVARNSGLRVLHFQPFVRNGDNAPSE
jgi:hypothetical protein